MTSNPMALSPTIYLPTSLGNADASKPDESSKTTMTHEPEAESLPELDGPVSRPARSLRSIPRKLKRLQRERRRMQAQVQHVPKKEPPPTPYEQKDIANIIQGLSSKDEELFKKTCKAVKDIAIHQPDLYRSDIAPLAPSILPLIMNAIKEERQSDLIKILSAVGSSFQETFDDLERHPDFLALILMMKGPAPTVRKSVVKLLNEMLKPTKGSQEGAVETGRPELEDRLVEVLQTRFYNFKSQNDDDGRSAKAKAAESEYCDLEATVTLSVIKALAISLREKQVTLGLVSMEAGALEFLLEIARTPTQCSDTTSNVTPTLADLRIAAISCLDQLLSCVSHKDITPADFPHLPLPNPEPRLALQGYILKPLLDLIDDPDLTVSDHVVELLDERYRDAGNPVEIFLWTYEGSLERTVHKLAMGGGKYDGRGQRRLRAIAELADEKGEKAKDMKSSLLETYSRTLDQHSHVECLLDKACSRIPQGVVSAFSAFWGRGDMIDSVKHDLFCALAYAPRQVRLAARFARVPVPPEQALDAEWEDLKKQSSEEAKTPDERKIYIRIMLGKLGMAAAPEPPQRESVEQLQLEHGSGLSFDWVVV